MNKQELLKIGATVRLQELNRERDELLKILSIEKEESIIEHIKKRKKKHWTQTKIGREKIRKIMIDRWKKSKKL